MQVTKKIAKDNEQIAKGRSFLRLTITYIQKISSLDSYDHHCSC